MKQNKRGVAMILALLLVIALEALIVGSMLTGMQVQRTFQRDLNHTKMIWASEAIENRIIQLLDEYVQSEGKLPDTDPSGLVLGNDSDITNHETFSEFAANWYVDFQEEYLDVLQNVQAAVNDVTLKKIETTNEGTSYNFLITLKNPISKSGTKILQKILLKTSSGTNPFDYSVFYNDDLEISPSGNTNLTVQGPIFSNGDVYVNAQTFMQNDTTSPTISSTLKFIKAANYAGSTQPYVIQSAGNFYVGPKRFVGRNYLLDNATYLAAVPDYYKTMPNELEVSPDVDLGASATPRFLPRVYNVTNIQDYYGDKQAFRPIIKVENAQSQIISLTDSIDLARPVNTHKRWVESFALTDPNRWTSYYTIGYSNATQTFPMNVSSTFDITNTSTWTGKPMIHPNWNRMTGIIEDNSNLQNQAGASPIPNQVLDFGLPLDSSINPSGVHALIEALTGTQTHPSDFQPGDGQTRAKVWDTSEIAKAKIQSKANLVLYFNSDRGGASPDLQSLLNQYRYEDPGVSDRVDTIYGVSENRSGNNGYYLNLNTVLTHRPGTKVIYFHVPAKYYMVVLEHGERLPEQGLTIATNGRIFIVGDFNTFSYHKTTSSGGSCAAVPFRLLNKYVYGDSYDSNCYITKTEWDNGQCLSNGGCTPPPAAILSDSFGVATHTDNLNYALQMNYLKAQKSLMINTALVTGSLKSRIYPRLNCQADMANCYFFKPDNNSSKSLSGVFTSTYFYCSDGSYTSGQNGVSDTCEYYREQPAAGVYHYYLNPKSAYYQDLSHRTWGGAPSLNYPVCDPAIPDVNNPQHCSHVRIPIFVDANDTTKAVAPMFGIHFRYLEKNMMDQQTYMCDQMSCTDGSTPRLIRAGTQYGYRDPFWGCANLAPVNYSCSPPPFSYQQLAYKTAHPKYEDLYNGHYSGGLESLINFHEDWSNTEYSLRFFGSLTVPYESIELKYSFRGDGTDYESMAYYGSDWVHPMTPARFIPPKNITLRYNENFKTNSPPGFGNEFTIKRERWKEVESE